MVNENGLQLVRKAVEALDLLARDRELTPAQIAELTGEPRSSVYRLLTGLQQLELVEKGARRGTYRLGLHLLQLGESVKKGFDERALALPVMEKLHDLTGETIFLCIRRGSEAVCIERLDGKWVQTLALQVGGSLPLHAGAAPRVLLANAGREFWHEYLRAGAGKLEAFTPATPTAAEDLIPELENTLHAGVAVSDGDVTVGIAALGVPVTDYRGDVRAALSISGVRPSILGARHKEIRENLIAAGREISRSLGADLAN
ncbi:IclR family transcriptional regulator [Kitasatospora sp. NPDC001603]|uniref:IclR family transcriptional regulator n=1 Tax=Kitasatospora sp. NPDC001603 TaxID=3154388 RepID=UPI003318850F